ncbi:MAG: hypothetical protein HGA67_02560 [Candidatus Yonathbacteria bacterium]|nr:hypothetical protein [Candidatus Yonathbacteria bacterium]
MVNASQTSFIPKQSLSPERRKRSSGSWLLTSIAGVILITSLVGAGGVFFYERVLTSRVNDMRDRLERMRSAFEPELITELKRLDNRLTTLDNILNHHVALSEFFSILEESTLQSVRFSQFAYNVDDTKGTKIVLAGEAANYSSVALQSDIFGQSRYFHNPMFSDMTLDNKGNVTFNVAFYLDSSLVQYTPAEGNESTSFESVSGTMPSFDEPASPASASATSESESTSSSNTPIQ